MNNKVKKEETAEPAASASPTPGQILKQARVSLGLSIEDVASKNNLKPAIIDAIDHDRFDEHMAATFTRGYLKVYAKQVKVPEAQVLEAYEKLNVKEPEPSRLQSFSRRVTHETNDSRLMLVSWLIFFGLVGSFVWWWWQQSSNTEVTAVPAIATEVSSSQEGTLPSLVVDEEPEAPVLESNTPLKEQSAEQVNPPVDDFSPFDLPEEEQTASEVIPAEEIQSEATTVSQVDVTPASLVDAQVTELVFTFADDCWVNIIDASGERIAYGTKKSGRVMPVSGVAPFEVTLGIPESVSILFDGQPVDISHFPAGRIARFTLPLQD